jgi:hypothetical protein
MTVNPRRDRKDEKIEKLREEGLEKDRKIEELTEKVQKISRKQTPPEYRTTPPEYGMKRRPAIRRIVLGVTAVVLAAAGGLWYISTPAPRQEQQYTTTEVPQTVSSETSEQRTTLPQSTIDPNNPDTWPLRNSLQELKDAQFENSSLSQYILPEYDAYRDIHALEESDKTLPPQYWLKLTSEDGANFWNYVLQFGQYSHAPDVVGMDGMVGMYILRTDQTYEVIPIVRWKSAGAEYWNNTYSTGLHAVDVLRMWEPNDPLNKVLFRNDSGTYKTVAIG